MGAFIYYAEKNRKLKNNFENHTRTMYGLSNEKQQITDTYKFMDDFQKR